MPLLEAKGLVKTFNERRVVDQVGFHVDKGEIVGLLGRNGAGKSTLMHILGFMDTPTEGSIVFDGKPVTGTSARARRDSRE